MAAENSRILTGLPNVPAAEIDAPGAKYWSEFLTVYRAIENVVRGVSEFSGIDPPDAIEVNSMDPTKYIQEQNLAMWYPVCEEAGGISRGQFVRLTGSAGTALAIGNTEVNCAIGIADETKAFGQRIKILLSGMTTGVSGMVTGTKYFLSPTIPGAIQNLPPVGVGQCVQPLGYAMSAGQMFLRVSSFVRTI